MRQKNNFSEIKKVHFIGIGGIGVSAIARMMLLLGKEVSGSDKSHSIITEKLKKEGAKIFIGHKSQNLKKGTDVIIYTIAVKKDNSELLKARQLNIKTFTYPEALGFISHTKKTIAVSGTHGKTTTTAMLAGVLKEAKFSPTVIVGSLMNNPRDNFIAGKGPYLVCEACEYQESFLNISPFIAVVTNIDNDHLDYYKNIINIQKAFGKFVQKVPKNGYVVCNKSNKFIRPILKKVIGNVVDYSIHKVNFKLSVPGAHNRENAKAVLAVGNILGIKKNIIVKALRNFKGTWRRQEYKGRAKNGALVYDDYAHHPTEISATLSGFRELFPKKEITVVFQPHLYSRTKFLLNDFARKLGKGANYIIITDIYAAREKKDRSISGKHLAEKIKKHNKNVLYISKFSNIVKELRASAGKKDVIITMGAGDIYKVGEDFINK